MKNQINISNLTPEQIEDLREQLKNNGALPIKDFEGLFYIFPNGQVFALPRFVRENAKMYYSGGFLSIRNNSNGYPCVKLHVNGKVKFKQLHRLIAEHFLPNPNPKEYDIINHKDCDKVNYKLENLEWCNHSLNHKHAYKNGLRFSTIKHKESLLIVNKMKIKPIIDKESGEIIKSSKILSERIGISQGAIKSRLLNRNNKYFAYRYIQSN